MGINELCIVCKVFTSARLKQYSGTDNWFFEDSRDQNNKELNKLSLENEVIIRKGLPFLDRPCSSSKVPNLHKVFLHHSVSNLLEASENGCFMCTVFKNGLKQRSLYTGDIFETALQGLPVLSFMPRSTTPENCQRNRKVDVKEGRFNIRHANLTIEYYCLSDITPVADITIPVYLAESQSIICPSDRFKNGVRVETLLRIQEWLESCKHHRLCNTRLSLRKPDEVVVPTRLIKLHGTPLKAQLIETDHLALNSAKEEFNYVALSHRWGDETQLSKLLKSNLESYLKDIPLEAVSSTFREAMIFCSTVGMAYIWIDALCIIQDLNSDWLMEAPKMMSVYSRASLTLCCTSDPQSGGLFCQRYSDAACVFDASWTESSSNVRLFVRSSKLSSYPDIVEDSSHGRRAWVFQEKLLSPRIVYFTPDQIRWECTVSRFSESGEEDSHSNKCVKGQYRQYFESFENKDWKTLLKGYSGLEMSRKSDKLVALSGIAEAFCLKHERKASEYTAGTWESDGVERMLWYAELASGKDMYVACSNPEGESLHEWLRTEAAPSWSWASYRAKVGFLEDLEENFGGDMTRRWNPCAEIIKTTLKHATENLFGSLIGGHMYYRGLLHPVELDKDRCQITFPHLMRDSTKDPEIPFCQRLVEDSCFFDHVEFEEQKSISEIYFSPVLCDIVYNGWTSQRIYIGILLKRMTGDRGTYSRCGLLELDDDNIQYPDEDAFWWTRNSSMNVDDYIEQYYDGSCKICIR